MLNLIFSQTMSETGLGVNLRRLKQDRDALRRINWKTLHTSYWSNFISARKLIHINKFYILPSFFCLNELHLRGEFSQQLSFFWSQVQSQPCWISGLVSTIVLTALTFEAQDYWLKGRYFIDHVHSVWCGKDKHCETNLYKFSTRESVVFAINVKEWHSVQIESLVFTTERNGCDDSDNWHRSALYHWFSEYDAGLYKQEIRSHTHTHTHTHT